MRLLLEVTENPVCGHAASSLYFRVADLPGAFGALQAQEVVFVAESSLVARMPDRMPWMAFFEDGEGNTMALMAEVGHAQNPG